MTHSPRSARRWDDRSLGFAVAYRHGFTLVEAMLVVTITGLLSMVGLPAFTSLFQRQAAAVAADRFVRAHELARATAVRYERVTEFHIDAATQRVWVVVDTNGTGVRDTIGDISILGGNGSTMSSTDSLICLDGRGLPSTTNPLCQSAAGTIIFSAKGGVADTVTITTLGKVLR